MPSLIYLSSGDEFMVTMPYAKAQDVLDPTHDLIEFTVIRWRDPDGECFEDLPDVPTYTESPTTVRASTIVAVRRCEQHVAASIERGRLHPVE